MTSVIIFLAVGPVFSLPGQLHVDDIAAPERHLGLQFNPSQLIETSTQPLDSRQSNPACPANTLYSQMPNLPGGFFNAGTSEASRGLQRFDYFHGVGGAVIGVRWWGLDLRYLGGGTWAECTEPDNTFDISFHTDAGGVPGAAVCSYRLLASRTPTGLIYGGGAELNEYEVSLPSSCVMVRGWISIVGRGDPDCWFLWMSSTDDNDESYCSGCASSIEDNDLSFCLIGNTGGVFGACCDDTTSQCGDEKIEMNTCVADTQRFLANAACADFSPPCGVILGACCKPDATCQLTEQSACPTNIGIWLGPNTSCNACPCVTPCPANSLAEGEPDCSDTYVDTFNGGCNANLRVYEPIPLGRPICGRGGIFKAGGGSATGDWDYYEVHISQATQLSWTVNPEFPIQSWITDGNNGCPPAVLATAQTQPCSSLELFANVQPGTYWLVVTASQFTDEAVCGAKYTAMAKTPVNCISGDMNNDGQVNGRDIACFINCLMAYTAICGDCRCGDVNASGTTDTSDIGGFVNLLVSGP